jgi:hypothetical protein
VQEKVVALHTMRALVPEAFDNVFHELETTRKWVTPTEQDVRANFMPWLLEGVQRTFVAHLTAQRLVEGRSDGPWLWVRLGACA